VLTIDWNDGILEYWNVGFGRLGEWGDGVLGKNLSLVISRRQMKGPLIKSFCGGPGGGFFKKSPLAAGGNKKNNLI
jgi:hypothetical protein